MSKIKNFWSFFKTCLVTLFRQTRHNTNEDQPDTVAANPFNFFDLVYHHDDKDFFDLFEKGIAHDKTPMGGRNRRFWQMIQFFKSVRHLNAEIAEAGVLYGLSSFLLGHYEKEINPGFTGETLHLFDSFQGMSMPGEEDTSYEHIQNEFISNVIKHKAKYTGTFLPVTKETLKEFPQVHFHKGWIPGVFEGQKPRKYKFVHIDLDLYEPILKALEFFYPQVVSGGCIVIDDYGYKDWPGAKRAVDEFAKKNNCQAIYLITGNAVIFKK